MSDEIDLDHVVPANPGSRDKAWRLHAVKLAVERKLAGRARTVRRTVLVDEYVCISLSTDAVEHKVTIYGRDEDVVCDCTAGLYGNPCGHAGAALLLRAGLAPEDRDG